LYGGDFAAGVSHAGLENILHVDCVVDGSVYVQAVLDIPV
jgi:hypothetical protein